MEDIEDKEAVLKPPKRIILRMELGHYNEIP